MDSLEGKIQQVLGEGMAAFQKTLAEKFMAKSEEDTRRNQEVVEEQTASGLADELDEEGSRVMPGRDESIGGWALQDHWSSTTYCDMRGG